MAWTNPEDGLRVLGDRSWSRKLSGAIRAIDLERVVVLQGALLAWAQGDGRD